MSIGCNRRSNVKVLTRREMLREVVSKDTLKRVAKAWYGFKDPFSEAGTPKKPESLLDKVKKAESKHTKPIRKEG
jgi:hypothetical protein